jgi:hypothetical protein
MILNDNREKCLNLHTLNVCLWGWTKSEVYKRRVDTRGELLARILDAATRIKESEDQLRRSIAVFAHELQNALRLTVGYSNDSC